jgi:predicted alpha/beta superfamily hydrolase
MKSTCTTTILTSGLVLVLSGVAWAATPEPIPLGEKMLIHSEVLGEERTLVIRLPDGYESSKSDYPVLYLLDAEYFFFQGTSAVQFLAECGYVREPAIPQMILVGIVNVDRDRDFTPSHAPEQGPLRFPTSGGAERFRRFLEQEAFPVVSRRYRTNGIRALFGWSLGGLFAVDTYFSRTELFSAYLAVSPSLWWDGDAPVRRAAGLLENGWASPHPLVVTLGAEEGGDMGRSVRDGFSRLVEKSPRSRWDITFLEIAGEGHNSVPYKALLDGLKALFADWRVPPDLVKRGYEAVESHYRSLSRKYGSPFEIPCSALLKLAGAALNSGDTRAAIELATTCANKYPRLSRAPYLLGLAEEGAGELEAARAWYQKALDAEARRPMAYSENVKVFRPALERVEKNIEDASPACAH